MATNYIQTINSFNREDSYSVSSGVKVFNYWNPFVTKHDTSSFYNWEQDNLPLYDLEERTQYLWEKLGYPLSGAPGMAYVVSSSIDSTLAASANIFTTVSAAIEALPEIIRMPTIIEVAVTGDMGQLNLNNIKCEDDGVLEIVNRAYAAISDNTYTMHMLRGGGPSITSSIAPMYAPNVLSGDTSGFLSTVFHTEVLSVSAVTSGVTRIQEGTECPVRSLIVPGRWNSSADRGDYSWEDIGGYIHLGINTNTDTWRPITPTANSWNAKPFYVYANTLGPKTGSTGTTVVADTTINNYDVSTIREDNQGSISTSPFIDGQLAKGIWAANWFSRIKVQNCDGPVYIRGFVVDGNNATPEGIGAYNCDGLTLENCGAMRCTTVGFDIKNSQINLRRQAIAARNYKSTGTTPTDNRSTITSYGFKATNSDISFVTDTYASGMVATLASQFHDYGIYLDNSKLHGGDKMDNRQMIAYRGDGYADPMGPFYTDIGFNGVGLYCSNSKYSMNGVTTAYNNRTNIEARNSVIEVEQLRSSNAQSYGLLMDSSDFKYNKNLNPRALGLNTLRKNASTVAAGEEVARSHNYPILFSHNGQHVVLKGGSTYGPTYPTHTSGIDITTMYNQEIYYTNHGRVQAVASFSDVSSTPAMKPSVVVDNSLGEFTCAKFIAGPQPHGDPSVPRHLLATNNGTATVRGLTNIDSEADGGTNTVSYFDGPSSVYCAAAIADNNSIINFTGPVAIYNHGFGAIATNNSMIKAGPPLDEFNAYVDTYALHYRPSAVSGYNTSGWGGGKYKATPVLEIHCQGAALVADNKSSIVLEELGYAPAIWNRRPESRVQRNDSIDLLVRGPLETGVGGMQVHPSSGTLADLCSSGAVQFYPNESPTDPNVSGMTQPMRSGDSGTKGGGFIGTSVTNNREYTQYLKKDVQLSCYSILYQDGYGDGAGGPNQSCSSNIQTISTGGMCVRAVNDSSVKVRNVHFPMGHPPSTESYYDTSSNPAGCGQILIWNIADTSRLDAAYLAVSGVYPNVAGYHGPGALYLASSYLNNAGINDDDASGWVNIASSIPSGTPDTGKIAVLDHFGKGRSWPEGAFDDGFGSTRNLGLSAFMSSIGNIRRVVTTTPTASVSGSYGASAYENAGPFRLFFSVLPAAKVLSYTSGLDINPYVFNDLQVNPEDTIPAQHLAQGYLLSGSCSGPADFSGYYPQLLNERTFDMSGVVATSGYYWPSALMPVERASVWLDESAANTFANAKHCNTNYSNRIKLVNIYRSRTDLYGETYVGNLQGRGFGFRTSNIFDTKRRT